MRWNRPAVLGWLAVLAGALLGAAAGAETTVTVESENFLVTAPSVGVAKDVLYQAEAYRLEIARAWLGEKLPPSVGRAFVRVKLSDVEDKALSLIADNQQRLSHSVWLTTSVGGIPAALGHEMVHVVLATRYPGALPAWVHEGIAGAYDGPPRQAARNELVAWFAKTNNWPDLGRLLQAELLPRQDTASHAAAASVTEFFLRRGDRQALLHFALAGVAHGWDGALQRYYQIQDAAHLQRLWQAWAAGPCDTLAARGPAAVLPARQP